MLRNPTLYGVPLGQIDADPLLKVNNTCLQALDDLMLDGPMLVGLVWQLLAIVGTWELYVAWNST